MCAFVLARFLTQDLGAPAATLSSRILAILCSCAGSGGKRVLYLLTGGKCNRFDRVSLGRINEPTGILENSRIDSAPTDFAAPLVGKYEFSAVPSCRCHVAIEVGVEATR
jgi:hypothetical protein